MKTISLGSIASLIKGKLISGNPNILVTSANIGNYKAIKQSQIYFVRKKMNLETQYKYINSIRPICVVIPEDFETKNISNQSAIIKVKNTYVAYWALAKWNWKHFNPLVIGITGSAGKSTTTSMVASILKKKYPTVTTAGNLNTTSFLCNYLTKLNKYHKLLLLEMGMNSRKDIATQCKIVKPTIGAITNVGEAHVGSLGSLEGIVKAKEELLTGIVQGGVIYLNKDDLGSKKLDITKSKAKVKYFSVDSPADIVGSNINYTDRGMTFNAKIGNNTYPMLIPTFGKHSVYNALAAIGVALEAGATIKEIQSGLASFKPPRMRLQLIKGQGGRLLINDAWNANPTAMKAGLEVLKKVAKQRPSIAVLGDMQELGAFSTKGHKEVGHFLAGLNITSLITYGTKAKIIAAAAKEAGMNPNSIYSYTTKSKLHSHLKALPRNSIVYFKASRKMYFEKIVYQLR